MGGSSRATHFFCFASGIYIKPDNVMNCNNRSGQITNILYEDIHILSPFWWAVWIGPQQQHEPHTKRGAKCSLFWPIEGYGECPSPGCVDMENITLRNVHIYEPVLSPGVILGNETNPIRNLVFDHVWVTDSKRKPWIGKWPFHKKEYPWRGRFKCINAEGWSNHTNPVPWCLPEIEN